jgi:diguanylate cyclase (GGDEF)-like protein
MVPTAAGRQLAARVGEWQVWTLRPVAKVYVIALVGLDWALTVTALVAAPRISVSHLGLYLALIACAFIVVEATRTVKDVKGTSGRDLNGVWYLPITILFPPGYAFLAPLLVEAYRLARVRRFITHRRLFSSATISLGWGAASILFHAVPSSIAGPSPQPGADAATWLLLAAGCCFLAWAVNNGLVLVAVRLATPEVRMREAFGGRTAFSTDLVEISMAVAVALVVTTDALALILALPPVVLCQRYLMKALHGEQVRVDAQSGVLTFVLWRHEAEVEALRARRTHTPLTVVLAEVDDFASIGGTGVPEAETQVLHAIGTMLTDKLPPVAHVGRLRGAEFAIVLPGVAADEARRLAARIRDHLAAGPVEVERDGHLDFVVRPTVSVGVAEQSDSRQTVTELIAAADAALATARASGGNRVSVAAVSPGVAQARAG